MNGAFARWQPEYAAHGLATFPVRDKRPAVSNYLKMGLRASNHLARKFANDDAFGIACKRSRLAVVDIDAPDERLLAEALSEYGPTPFVVRTASGGFHAWYRHKGEARKIRPDPSRPIDILGDGFVVAPPSVGTKGAYEIIGGSLDDLDRLPAMRRPEPLQAANSNHGRKVAEGERNQSLFIRSLREARLCANIDQLMLRAREANRTMFYEPLPDEEVLRVVASAWAKESSGNNWVGTTGRVVIEAEAVDAMGRDHPDAFILLAFLKRHNWGRKSFVVANAMHELVGQTRKRFTTARNYLVKIGELRLVNAHSRHAPATYAFKGGQL